MLNLLNAWVMPNPGKYECKKITANEAKAIFQKHLKDYKSYIGYPNSCKVLSELFGVQIGLCRDSFEFKNGDMALAARLTYRVPTNEKSTREHGQHLADYEFALITFSI